MTAFGACIAAVAGTCINGICFGQSAAESLVECTHIADESARLRCYDEHMRRLGHPITADTPAVSKRALAAAPPAPASPAAPESRAQAPPAVSKESEFGLAPDALRRKRAAETPGTEPPEQLVSRVKAVSELAHGELRIELDNGQLWVETEAQWSGSFAPAAGETVTIKHGALGSYFLTRQSGPALRVKRIR